MKKLYLLLFFCLGLIGFGQTYTATFSFYGNLCEDKSPLSPLLPLADEYQLQIKDGTILSQTSGKTSTTGTGVTIVISNMPVRNNYDLMIEYYCGGGDNMLEYYTNTANFNNAHILECIVNGFATPSSYTGSNVYWITMEGLKPNNITINNLSTTDICAGQQIQLACFLKGFPAEVYHWQYSFDNQVSWIDIPNKIINGLNINNTETTKFSIYDILGNDHLNHFGKIFFRIGYSDRPVSNNVIEINYSACGPTVSEVSFEGPGCNGDIVKSLSVTFNEKLNSAVEEKLASISVVDINNDSKIFMQVNGPISYPDDTKKYTYTSFQQLENGHTYRIKYQAQIPNPNDASKPIMRGVLYSPEEFNFIYTEPQPLTFKINAENPVCNNDKVDITIEASGGTPPYYYDHLNGETEIIDGVSQVKRIRFDSSDINRTTVELKDLELKKYNIKVTDTNKCIEQ